MGVLGTATGLLFIDPEIRSLFDQFIAILGMFLGVLAGLFALGVTSRRASALGSLIGAVTAILLLASIALAAKVESGVGQGLREVFDHIGVPYRVHPYLYAFHWDPRMLRCRLFGQFGFSLSEAESQRFDAV